VTRREIELFRQENNLDWFPRMQAMSLSDAESDSEQNELRTLQNQLKNTNQLIAILSSQLNELREQVCFSTLSDTSSLSTVLVSSNYLLN